MTTSTNSTFEEEIAAQDASAHAHLVDLAYAIHVINEQVKPLEEAKEKYVKELKQLMQLADLSDVPDGEHGIVASLKRRSSPPTYDLVSLIKNGEADALVDAASMGLARIDHKALESFDKGNGSFFVNVLKKYQTPGVGTEALYVGESK